MKPANKVQAALFEKYLKFRTRYEELSIGASAAFLRQSCANAYSMVCYEKIVAEARKQLLAAFTLLMDQGIYYDVDRKIFRRRPSHG